jgi:hypothetical protein
VKAVDALRKHDVALGGAVHDVEIDAAHQPEEPLEDRANARTAGNGGFAFPLRETIR